MNKPIKFLVAVALTVLSVSARANSLLTLCNENLDRKVFATFMRQVGAGAGWQSAGWYSVDQGKCRDIDLGSYEGKVYVYGNDEFHETAWGDSDVQYCIHGTEAFVINNSDTIACTGPGQKKVNSDEVSVAEGSNTYIFRRNFSQIKFCNLNQTFSLFAAFAKKVGTGFQSKGWYLIPQKECRVITVGKYTGSVRYYAEYNGGQLAWGGGPQGICVNRSQAFLIENAENELLCTAADKKMVKVSTVEAGVGVTTVNFEAAVLKTTLQLCNRTKDSTLYSVYGTATVAGSIRSVGWVELLANKCKSIDLDTYQGTAYLYAEANGGDIYWGSGPVNVCADKTAAFAFEDGANSALCSSTIKNKMVPTFQFNVGNGMNTFSFEQ